MTFFFRIIVLIILRIEFHTIDFVLVKLCVYFTRGKFSFISLQIYFCIIEKELKDNSFINFIKNSLKEKKGDLIA